MFYRDFKATVLRCYFSGLSHVAPAVPVVRTAKAERRMQDREGALVTDGDQRLSASEQRALEADKRAAWRQARLILNFPID